MDHSGKSIVCIISAFWAAVVVIYTLLHILSMDLDDSVFGHFCKIGTMALGVIQFTLSGMLLSYVQRPQTAWTKQYYCFYLLTAVVTSTLYLVYYIFKEAEVNDYGIIYWGFTYYDLIMYIDIFVFVLFIVCYPTPKPGQGPNGNGPNARRARNVDWIAKSVTPERVITGYGQSPDKAKPGRIDNNNLSYIDSDLPYARMSNESIA